VEARAFIIIITLLGLLFVLQIQNMMQKQSFIILLLPLNLL